MPSKRFFLAVCYTEWMDYFSDPYYVNSKPVGIDEEMKKRGIVSPDKFEHLLETLQKKAPLENNTSASELEEDSRISNDPSCAEASKTTPPKKEHGNLVR